MKTLSLSGSPRNTTGKKDTSSLRKNGNVPCILYGGKERIHFSATEKDFKSLVYTPDVHLVKLELGEKKYDAILKDIQFHPVTDSILHVDFLEVFPDKSVVMNIPVKLHGTPIGVKEGGKLLKKLPMITIKGLISKIPGAIELDVANMKIGDSIRIRDLKYDGVSFLHESNVTVVAVRIIVEVVETPAAAAPGAVTPAEGAAPASAGAASAVAGAPAAPSAPAKEEKKPARSVGGEEKKK